MPVNASDQGWVLETTGYTLGAFPAHGGLKFIDPMSWAHAGLQLELGDFESTVRRIRRVEAKQG